MANQVLYFDKARYQILRWMSIIADTVRVTMWPKGRNVIIGNQPIVTNDWVTVAQAITLENPVENIWATIIKQAAEKTNAEAGDGTTSTVVLTHAIALEWLKHIARWVNPFALTKSLKDMGNGIRNLLEQASKRIATNEEIQQIATLSAQDEAVGKIIAECVAEVGKDGTIAVVESNTIGMTKEIKSGMQFEQWYISPYFVTNEQRWECVIDNPLIIVTDQKIMSRDEIGELLDELVMNGKRNIVIIANDVEWEALSTLLLNRHKLNSVAVKAPWFGDNRKYQLQDLAVMCWAMVISPDNNLKFSDMHEIHLWQADKVIVTEKTCTIVNGKGDEKLIADRVALVKWQLAAMDINPYDTKILTERLAKLSWGVATIKIWCATEMETKNRKYKIEDALQATKAAYQEWIIAWWWIALYRLAKSMETYELKDREDEIARQILSKALQYPLLQIVSNAGYRPKDIMKQLAKIDSDTYGFDAKEWEFADMFMLEIIDPVKVVRIAVENAISAASMLLTTDAVVYEIPTE